VGNHSPLTPLPNHLLVLSVLPKIESRKDRGGMTSGFGELLHG